MKTSCQHAPLRMFMGLQMIGWGVLIEVRGAWSLEASVATDWLWPFTMVTAGAWIVVAAMAESYVRTVWPRVWTPAQRVKYRHLMTYTVMGYFFGGAAWGGVATNAMYERTFQDLDFLCPLFMLFLFYLAFTDASKKRKGTEANNEKTKKSGRTALLHAAARLYAERVGR